MTLAAAGFRSAASSTMRFEGAAAGFPALENDGAFGAGLAACLAAFGLADFTGRRVLTDFFDAFEARGFDDLAACLLPDDFAALLFFFAIDQPPLRSASRGVRRSGLHLA